MGGSAAARIDQQRCGAALAPGASVRRVEGAACDAILIDPVGLTDDDAAMGLIRTGEQPAGVADGEPIGMAEIVGPATHQARPGPAVQGLLERQAHTGDSGDQADGDGLHSAEIEGAQDIQQRRVADDTARGADTPARPVSTVATTTPAMPASGMRRVARPRRKAAIAMPMSRIGPNKATAGQPP